MRRSLHPDQAPDPSLAKQEYQEYIIPDTLKGEQKIVARFITQFETPTSFYRFFRSADNPPGLYVDDGTGSFWAWIHSPAGPIRILDEFGICGGRGQRQRTDQMPGRRHHRLDGALSRRASSYPWHSLPE